MQDVSELPIIGYCNSAQVFFNCLYLIRVMSLF